ncbi:MAG: tetraacyldisaccharide 4'-kinase [Ferruginibacter sp.]
MLKSFRYLLFPFAFVYGVLVSIRNWLFDKKISKSATFNFPIICVGNLAVGGTGKTPMVEYLVEILQNEYDTATLSRGYKRKTKGFTIANAKTTAIDIGDEPMQFHQKFPRITVAVGEERLVAIPQILHQRPETEVIILDDAFQHRSVKAGLNILLTEYKNLYTRDHMMPSGDLRDVKSSSKRADIIIVTKCKIQLDINESAAIVMELSPLPNQQVFFTEIVYDLPYHLFDHHKITIGSFSDVLLVCGIANPKPLVEFLTTHVHSFDMNKFPDHHIFSIDDLHDIKKNFEKLNSQNKIILTTEKDAVRLQKYVFELSPYPVYVLPIKHRFLFGDAAKFNGIVKQFISSYKIPQA